MRSLAKRPGTEVTVRASGFTVSTVPGRLAKLRKDPWADFWSVRQSLRQDIRRKLGAA